MKTVSISTLAGWLVAVGLSCGAGTSAAEWRPEQASFFVSPGGNDAWTGRQAAPTADGKDGPFATVHRARDAVRAVVGQPGQGPVVVLLRDGTYELVAALAFTPDDSGTADRPVVYAAYPGERPVLSGGSRVTGWEAVGEGLWCVRWPGIDGRGPRRLYVDGQHRPLARTPDAGSYFRVQGLTYAFDDPATPAGNAYTQLAFRFREGDLQAWPRLGEANVVVLRCWESAMLPIKEVDEAAHGVLFTGPMKWPFEAGQRYYVEGLRDGLDAPGEWWHDRVEGRLYYRPKPGEDMGAVTVVVPRLTELVRLTGDAQAGRYVEHLRFEGLTFCHTDYVLPAEGHGEWQSAVTIPAVFMADGARSISLTGCELRNLGQYAVWFRHGCSENRVEACEISDVGAGGVRLGGEGPTADQAQATGHCTVSNCFIHDGGSVYYGAIPVWIGQSSDNLVSHNEICDFNYTGISVGWSWGFAPTTCHRNTIEYNHLHHLGRNVLYDMAAIYTLGISTGTVIRNNHIHDIWGFVEGYGAGGIYPDEGSSGLLIENNLVYRVQSGGLTIHYGRDNVVRNNIFAFGQLTQIYLGRPDMKSSQTLTSNIVYYERGSLIERLSDLVCDRNLYWHTGGADQVVFPGGKDLAAWRQDGYDRESLVADPGFAAPEQDDFRLKPDSPALALGFKPFDASAAGLTGDPAWVAKAETVRRPRTPLPPMAEPPQLAIRDDCEDTPVGRLPMQLTTHGTDRGATILISDARAASGKHSLRFLDAEGLTETWNPHCYVYPNIATGTVVGEFDLWLGPGAVFSHEWRTNASPFIPGPSLEVDATGALKADGRELVRLPHEQWVHLLIRADLRPEARGTWSLAVTLPGAAQPQSFELACPKAFTACQWVVYVSNATSKAEFFLDNLRLEQERATQAAPP
jgi:hypothetical protein